MELKDNMEEGYVDVQSEIGTFYSYNKHPKRGYHCAYTEGMGKFGCPELVLMDYFEPGEAEEILLNVADCILNGEFYDQEEDAYDFFSIVALEFNDDRGPYRFGFIGGYLYDQEVMCLQLLNEEDEPIHPGGESLPSWYKRGFEPWPLFMYADIQEEDQNDQT